MSKKYIYIVCGGSGGHIMPGLGLYRIFSKFSSSDIIMVGVRRRESELILKNHFFQHKNKNTECIFLPDIKCKAINFDTKGFSTFSFSLKKVVYMVKLSLMFFYSLKCFINKPPKAVIGFGSYAAFPMVFLGALWKDVITIIHEQNVELGRANKFLAPLVDKITVTFEQSLSYFKRKQDNKLYKAYENFFQFFLHRPKIKEKVVDTGNPGVLRFLNLNREGGKTQFNILILGGSQGSKFLNTVVPETISSFKKEILNKLKVYHVAGEDDRQYINKKYRDRKVDCQVWRFSFNIGNLYQKADLVISRAGASTISEIKFFKIPSIIIPYPYARGHQFENTHLLKDSSAAMVIKESECDKNVLKENIQKLITNDSKREEIKVNLENIGVPNPKEKFISLLKRYNLKDN